MNWRSIKTKPDSKGDMKVLLANFVDGDFLVYTTLGWWYHNEQAFVPNIQRDFTHWMPYTEYWEAMSNLDRE